MSEAIPDGSSSSTCRIVVIACDADFAQSLESSLIDRGYRLTRVTRLQEAVAQVNAVSPDAIVIDLAPPEAEVLIVCAELKSVCSAPILLCSASPHHWARVGLRLGADDFVPKPLQFDQFEARLQRLMGHPRRREVADARGKPVLEVGDLVLAPTRHRATVGGSPLRLTPTEYRLLLALASRAGMTLTRDELVRLVWRTPPESGAHLVDMHVGRLRKKLGASRARIKTVRGSGFQLAPTQ